MEGHASEGVSLIHPPAEGFKLAYSPGPVSYVIDGLGAIQVLHNAFILKI